MSPRSIYYHLYRVAERAGSSLLVRMDDAEKAHDIALKLLPLVQLRPQLKLDESRLSVKLWDLDFSNPIGAAAGLDKDGERVDELHRSGFGYCEIGTVTPKPQPGNPEPRVFRLTPEQGVINRFGFNSSGHDAVLDRMSRSKHRRVIGVNVGANKDSADRIADYVTGISRFYSIADYLAVNISSPNTPHLRDLQLGDRLTDLLSRVQDCREGLAPTLGYRPILLKLAPDLSLFQLDQAIAVAREKRIDGLIVSNTTLSRPAEISSTEAGGLSGRPLFARSTRVLAETYVRAEKAFPIIGVGGIHDAPSAVAKIRAGASLIQLYSALIFQGMGLVDDIKAGIIRHLDDAHLWSVSELVGLDAQQIVSNSSYPVH